MLKRDRRWEIFYGDISLDQFVSEKLPVLAFKKEVAKEIVESFGIVYQLLVHSYYQYLFVDIAVTRALHIFEMALRIRFKELNGGKVGEERKLKLFELMIWFNGRSYFEIADKNFLNYVRKTRNHMTHPKGFDFAGAVGLPWINTVVDLINDLYEDIEMRKVRWKSTVDNKSKLDLFLTKGAKLTALDTIYYIYDNGPLRIENRLDHHTCYFSLLPIFDLSNTIPKIPLVFSCPLNKIDFSSSIIDLSFGTKKIELSNELNSEECEMISEFREKIKKEDGYRTHNSMLIFDASNTILKALRESLSYKIMQDYEFMVDIKYDITLETSRDHL